MTLAWWHCQTTTEVPWKGRAARSCTCCFQLLLALWQDLNGSTPMDCWTRPCEGVQNKSIRSIAFFMRAFAMKKLIIFTNHARAVYTDTSVDCFSKMDTWDLQLNFRSKIQHAIWGVSSGYAHTGCHDEHVPYMHQAVTHILVLTGIQVRLGPQTYPQAALWSDCCEIACSHTHTQCKWVRVSALWHLLSVACMQEWFVPGLSSGMAQSVIKTIMTDCARHVLYMHTHTHYSQVLKQPEALKHTLRQRSDVVVVKMPAFTHTHKREGERVSGSGEGSGALWQWHACKNGLFQPLLQIAYVHYVFLTQLLACGDGKHDHAMPALPRPTCVCVNIYAYIFVIHLLRDSQS